MRAEYFIGSLGWGRYLVQRRFHYQFVAHGGRALRDANPEDGTTTKKWCPLNRATPPSRVSVTSSTPSADVPASAEGVPPKRKRGRPKGSKNKRGQDGGDTEIKERVG